MAEPAAGGIIARLFVRDPEQFVAFAVDVFDARGEYQSERPSLLHFGDTPVMVSGIDARRATDSVFYIYVHDVDRTYQRALDRGATCLESPIETPWGDRRAILEDGFGTTWQIATKLS